MRGRSALAAAAVLVVFGVLPEVAGAGGAVFGGVLPFGKKLCAFASPLPLMGLRSSRGPSICMQTGDKEQPKKAVKKPRKRSQQKQNPFLMPEPTIKEMGGPIGKAKRRMLERIEEMEEKQEAQWSTLKGKLQQERIDKVWAANDPVIAEKRKRWNEDLTASSEGPEEELMDMDANAVDVMGTNDKNWKQVRDVSTGDIYFWNIKTEETVWDIPEGIVVEQKLSPFRGVTKTLADPGGAPGVKWLCTQTTSGHAHFGIFFQVKAKESDVYITGIRTASHYRSNIYEATYRVLVRDGACYGKELSKEGWRQVGRKKVKAEVKRWGPKKWDKWGLTRFHKSAMDTMHECLPAITYEDRDPETIYGALPLAEALHIKAGQSMSFCLWTNDMLGIVLRKKDAWQNKGERRVRRHVGGFFDKGEITDENADMILMSGLVPRQDLFRSVTNRDGYSAFTGTLEYVLDKSQVPEADNFVPLPENAEEEFEADLAEMIGVEGANKMPVETEQKKDNEMQAAPQQETTKETKEQKEQKEVKESVVVKDKKEQKEVEKSVIAEEDRAPAEEEEVDMEELLSGPEKNIFGGGGGDKDGELDGSLTLGVFMGDKDLGELVMTPDTKWEEVMSAVKELTKKDNVSLQYPHPDGTRVVKLTGDSSWAELLDLAADPEWDLDGFIEIEVKEP